MRRIAAIALLLPVLAGCASEKTPTSPTASADVNAPSYLMVQNAASASFAEHGDGYTLTLGGVDPATVYFTDRPNREAGSYDTGDFVDQIFEGDDPPNAAFVWRVDGEDQTVALELESGTYDEAAHTLTYEATVLEEKSGQLAEFGDNAAIPAGTVSPASLFIDSIFHYEQCYVAVYNGVQGADAAKLQVGTITLESSYSDGEFRTQQNTGPKVDDTIASGATAQWWFQAASASTTCGVDIEIVAWVPPPQPWAIKLYERNPSTDPNSWGNDCGDGYTCATKVLDNSTKLSIVWAICEAGVSQDACLGRLN